MKQTINNIFKVFVAIGLICMTALVCDRAKQKLKAKRANNLQSKSINTESIILGSSYSINEQTIDSCEYIIVFRARGICIVHKENCSNPIHKK